MKNVVTWAMLEHLEKERARGRFPQQSAIELLLVTLPGDLAEELWVTTSVASFEVSPRGSEPSR